MKKRDGILYQWGPVIFAAILTVIVFAGNLFGKLRTWADMCDTEISFLNGRELNLDNGDSYGIMTMGPWYNLPAGKYRLKWIIDCDDVNEVHLITQNQARIVPDTFKVNPDHSDSDIYFELLDAAAHLEIKVDFKAGTKINVLDFRMYSPKYRDNQLTFALIMALLAFLWRRHCTGKKIEPGLVLIAGAVIYASVPSLRDNFSLIYDTSFHVGRLWNLADGLASGQFPVRCAGYTYNGYGAITSIFYPDAYLYPAAILLLLGFSTNYVMQLIFISLNIVSAVTMYACAKRLFKQESWMPVLSSILYVLAIYRITDIYVRCALGEAIAMAFYPVFISGVFEVFFGNKKNWPILALGSSALFYSHVVTTFMSVLFLFCMGVLYFWKLIKERRIGYLLLAGFVTLVICLAQVVPMLHYNAMGIGAENIRGLTAHNSLAPAQLFLWGEGDMPVDPADWTLSGQPIEPGMILNIGIVLLVYAIAVRCKKESIVKAGLREKWSALDENERQALRMAFIGAVGAFATTTMFPWQQIGLVTLKFTDYIQFAWRFMIFPAAFFSLAGAFGYLKAFENKERATLMVFIIAVIMVLPTLGKQTRFDDVVKYGEITTPHLMYMEYNIPNTDLKQTTDRTLRLDDGITVSEYEKKGNQINCSIVADQAGKIQFPLFGFDGYVAKLNGQRMETSLGENNRLAVHLPAGVSGTLTVRYHEPFLWRMLECISLVALIWTCGMLKKEKRRAVL